ncbi:MULTISPECIES: acetyl-CoA carboxylase biotin carboxylase subunit family protein [unclassified Caballeronia]|uniref:ATP-grasp domain-containing protein n=1 Tax=unclassified Caballeronia TaxID=2646786 RepID=UPI002029AFE7|nr:MULTISPECIES: biotin carboxylase [unclassified Caballeronia]
MTIKTSVFLIIDYNLARVAEVAHMSDYARRRYHVDTLLIRANPGEHDKRLCDHVIALDPRSPGFVDAAFEALAPWRHALRGAIVFSDNAVFNGAALLERLGLPADSAELALGAFSKLEYRRTETRFRDILAAQRIMTPGCQAVATLEDLERFAAAHPEGFVIKPSCEGNNRGVVMLRSGDDLTSALNEVMPYLESGVICEQLIPYHREFSYDGVGRLSFVTEKVSASGRYPVEVAQVVPARLEQHENETLRRAGEAANWLVGQRDGPFHNEIKLSDDGRSAAVVEPNRRPAGMKIWKLAETVFHVDFYKLWIDSVLGGGFEASVLAPTCQAASVMLGVAADSWFAPEEVRPGEELLNRALAATRQRHGLAENALRIIDFNWLGQDRRFVPAVPRDNGDFVACVCISLHTDAVDIREVVASVRDCWTESLGRITSADDKSESLEQVGVQLAS